MDASKTQYNFSKPESLPLTHPIRIAWEQRKIREAWERQINATYAAWGIDNSDSDRLAYSDRK